MTLAGGMAVWPLAAHAQKPMPVIGHIDDNDLKGDEAFLASVRMGLADYGYVEGQNFRFEFREAHNRSDLYPALYRELVDQKVSVLIANSTLRLEVAKAARQTIPIIFLIGIDPVENGFVASLNRPGGNITGVFNFSTTLPAKKLQNTSRTGSFSDQICLADRPSKHNPTQAHTPAHSGGCGLAWCWSGERVRAY
jgi:putative ABC transport system substrate-binding protein